MRMGSQHTTDASSRQSETLSALFWTVASRLTIPKKMREKLDDVLI